MISGSEIAAQGRSLAIMSLISPRIAVAEHSPPLLVTIAREKKYLSSKTPIGMAMNLLLVTLSSFLSDKNVDQLAAT